MTRFRTAMMCGLTTTEALYARIALWVFWAEKKMKSAPCIGRGPSEETKFLIISESIVLRSQLL